MSTRLADRILEAVHQRFVGRAEECRLFEYALDADESPFYVLHVFGPGGVGKTSLLREFQYRCVAREVPVFELDGRTLRSQPDAFLEALRQAMHLAPEAHPLDAVAARDERCVLFIDTFERLGGLGHWLRQVFLPGLPGNMLVVIAGQEPLGGAWRRDPGWEAVVRSLPLRNLSPSESRAYLARAGLPEDVHDKVLRFTHGHPLALSLVVDVFSQRPGLELHPGNTPDIIKTLLDRLVMKVPSPAHRAALEACALVRFMTEPLLAQMVGQPDARDLFDWLRGRSFIEATPHGLAPHDLARDVLGTDVRWRNPDWYAELHDRARQYYSTRLQQVDGDEQRLTLTDYIYLHRDNPIIRPFYEQMQGQWAGDDGGPSRRLQPEADTSALVEMVARHEGGEAARWAAFWLERQPAHVLVFGEADDPIGLLFLLALDEASPDDRRADPATHAAWAYLEAHAPLRPGERATLFRFWMARDAYQDVSPVQARIFIQMVLHYLTTSGLAFSFLPCADPDLWAMIFAYADLERLPEADYTVEGRTYAVFGHDWRERPPGVWLDVLARRETSTQTSVPPPQSAPPVIVLSREAFAEALHDALRALAQPWKLSGNPLLQAGMIADRAGNDADEEDRIIALQALIEEAAEDMAQAPRLAKGYRAIERMYVRPAGTQEQAAELLNLPYSTFRRHLKAGLDELTAILWRYEVGRG